MVRQTQSSIIGIQTASNTDLTSEASGCFPQVAEYEHFVDEYVIAEFLGIKPRRVLEMARSGKIPTHPLGDVRKTWRFKISEVDAYFALPTHKRTSDPRKASNLDNS